MECSSDARTVGRDEQLFYDVVDIFLREAPKQIASMRVALALRDEDATERIAHTLKGELGYLGLSEAAHNASQLEEASRLRVADHQFARLSERRIVTKKAAAEARGEPRLPRSKSCRLYFKSRATAITTAVQKLNENKLAKVHVIRSFI